jgi:ATP-dependent Clp protease ATP-binding subunit ClpB
LETYASDFSSLERFGINLTHLARQGMFSPLAGYETCVNRIFQILLRKEQSSSKYNPILIDQDEQRRWLILTEVIRRMAMGNAPGSLSFQQIIALDYEKLLAGFPESPETYALDLSSLGGSTDDTAVDYSKTVEKKQLTLQSIFDKQGESDKVIERLQDLFTDLHQTEGQVILFANRFHYLVGIDRQNLLRSALARREIQLIGACTLMQHQSYNEHDTLSIQRRLQEVLIRSDEEL